MDSRITKLKIMMRDKPNIAVRPSKAQVLDILQDPTVSIPWGIYVDDIQTTAGLLLVNDKVLVQLIQKQNDLEVHICCKLRDRAGIKEVLVRMLKWVSAYNWNEIYTTAPDNRSALKKMLINLGFTEHKARWIYHGL